MQLEPQVTFKNVNPSDAILDQIHVHLARLGRKYPAIRCCRLVFERPLTGWRGEDRFRIDMVLTLAGDIEIAVSRDAPDTGREDPATAVSDAFGLIERRIEWAVNGGGKTGGPRASTAVAWEAR